MLGHPLVAPEAGVSVVVPAYNSELSLAELVRRLEPVLDSLAKRYELILVNDGSRDDTWGSIERLSRAFAWVRGVNLMRNYGQYNAVLCGIRFARFDVICTLDDDLQHPPEEIPKLFERLSADVDVVYGAPEHLNHDFFRRIATQVTKLALQSAMGAPVARRSGPFRVFRTHLRDAFAAYDGPYVSIDVLLTWATTRFTAVTVRHDPRRQGRSNYTLGKLVVHALNMITGFSTAPLRLASIVGFAFTLLGTLALFYVLLHYMLVGGGVPGFSFLASTIAIFSGAQLFSLGIIGEYLARMHARSMQQPTYAIRQLTPPSATGETADQLVVPVDPEAVSR